MGEVWRLHWWAYVRWWAFAAVAAGLFGTAYAGLAVLGWVLAAAGNAWLLWRTRAPRFVSVSVLVFVFGFGWVAAVSVWSLVVWAVWKTIVWWRTVILFDGNMIRVRSGVVTRSEVNIPPRRFTQAQWFQHPGAMALRYGTFRMESAGQVEFVDRIRFAPESLYMRVAPRIGV